MIDGQLSLLRPTIQAQFEQYDADNPWVKEAIEEQIALAVANGAGKVAIAEVVEYVRWHRRITTNDFNSPFKINNNYRSRYARLLIEEHPEWDGLIELRKLRSP